MLMDNIDVADRLTITVTRNGRVIETIEPISTQSFFGSILCALGLKKYTTDLVVTAGLASVTGFLITEYTHMAIGEGAVAPAMGNTTLGSEAMRVAFTSATQETTTYANDTARFVAEFTMSGDTAITEMGIFNNSSGGTMFQRQSFAVINLKAADVITMTLDVVLS
jgi:ABC-type sulfate transport system substrate-binding protein